MNKQKVFNILSYLGLGMMIFAIFGYVYYGRGDAVNDNKTILSQDFSKHFSNVQIKKRPASMVGAKFLSPEDKETTWRDFRGKYLLVNFWATWCGPCVMELPSLERLTKKLEGKNIEIIAVSLDTMRSHNDVKAFLYNRGIDQFAAYFDEMQQVQKNIFMRGIPTSFLLNPMGEVIYVFEGDAPWDIPSAINFFETLISEK